MLKKTLLLSLRVSCFVIGWSFGGGSGDLCGPLRTFVRLSADLCGPLGAPLGAPLCGPLRAFHIALVVGAHVLQEVSHKTTTL